ncbi:MAG TPA: DUF4013 domain-containing protein, partial [Anaerolineae bacterium]|nr:DUF4013 domain-containing protein [Anaerolineae bacterium]
MDIGKSLGYMFDDERGVNKLLVGGLISLVPILRWAATGYMLRTLKTVAAGAARPLPEWDDVVNDLVKGLLVTLAGMIYALPLLVTFVPIGGLMLTSLLSGGSSSQALDTINSILGLGTAGLWCLVVPYILLLAAWM